MASETDVRGRQAGRLVKPRSGWVARLAALAIGLVVVLPLAVVLLYRFVDPPLTLLMVQRAFQGEDITHQARRYTEISPNLVRAVIAAEDAKFCSHRGFDLEAIDNAMEYNARAEQRGSSKRRGASTISQQTAKNLFLWPQRSWVRKGLETYFTVLIEYTWPKRRIMEAYLNVAEWGDGRFGAEAAAQAIFGVSAKDLTPQQAARLAAVLPSPNKWRADNPGPYVRKRAGIIQQRMRVVQADGYDSCVLPRSAPPPKPRKPAQELPPLVEAPMPDLPPPPEALEPLPPLADAPVEDAAPPAEGEPSAEAPAAAPAAAPAPEAPPHTPSRIDPPPLTP